MMAALDFTEEELRRPHGTKEQTPPFGHRRWNAQCMYWEVFSERGEPLGTVWPDHERLTRAEHEYYAAIIDRMMSK